MAEAEINEMFEQAAQECENLTSSCDQASEQIGDLVTKIEKLGERADKEMALAHKAFEELSDRLDEAKQGLESKNETTRVKLSSLQDKGTEVQDKVQVKVSLDAECSRCLVSLIFEPGVLCTPCLASGSATCRRGW